MIEEVFPYLYPHLELLALLCKGFQDGLNLLPSLVNSGDVTALGWRMNITQCGSK